MKAKDLGNIVKDAAVATTIKSAIMYPIYAGVVSAMADKPYTESLADNWPFIAGVFAADLGIQYFKKRKERKSYDAILREE